MHFRTMDFDLNKWVASKRGGDVLVEHVGDFSSALIDSMLPAMEKKLQESVENENVRKRTFHIFVECAQNLYRHISPAEAVGEQFGSSKVGAILLTKNGSGCRITTGNFIPKDKSSELQELIGKINALDQEQLRALYRDTVSNKVFSDKGGAGLGMIDMARKSRHKLECQFISIKDTPELVFFSFDVCVS